MASGNLRRHTRNTFTAKIRVGWQDQHGQDKSAMTKSFDISESGMRFELLEPLALQSDIMVHCEKIGLKARAIVRSCARFKLNYVIGVEFGFGYRWVPPSDEVREALESAEMIVA